MNDYEFYEDITVSCEKCGNGKAYLWLDKDEQVHLISCYSCGVYEKARDAGPAAEDKKRLFCCEGFKEFSNQELYVDKNPRVFELRRKLFYYLENSPNPTVEQIKFCPFCGVKINFVGVAE